MGGPGSTRWGRHRKAPTVDDTTATPAAVCPRCGRRVRALYQPDDAAEPACRLCHGLTYQSSQESHRWDAPAREAAARLGMQVSPDEMRQALEGQARIYLQLRGRKTPATGAPRA